MIFLLCSTSCCLAVESRLCAQAYAELNLWGIALDSVLRIDPGTSISTDYSALPAGYGFPAYRDPTFYVDASNVAAVAQTLALEYPADYLEAGLRENLARGYHHIPLVPFLPKRVQDRLGQVDDHTCYYAAFNFHEDGSTIFAPMGHDLDKGGDFSPVRTRYSTLGYQDALKFGDILTFWGLPPSGTGPHDMRMFHAVVYIGGDIVYHKYAPRDGFGRAIFAYEFTTLQSLIRIYSNPLMGQIQDLMRDPGTPFRYGRHFYWESLRYDPQKRMPPARANPANANSLAPLR